MPLHMRLKKSCEYPWIQITVPSLVAIQFSHEDSKPVEALIINHLPLKYE